MRLILGVSFPHQRSFSLSLPFPGSPILEASYTALRETGEVRRGNIFSGLLAVFVLFRCLENVVNA